MSAALSRLYAILDIDTLDARGLDPLATAAAWLDAGIRLVQLRAKSWSFGPTLDLADRLVRLASASGARIVINDRADVARLSGAAGVHVGQDDLGPADARAITGPDALVGVSTHTLAQLEQALAAPVSYVAFGPVFPTRSKAHPDPVVGLEGVAAARRLSAPAGVPLVAIGGITRARAPAVLAAGASSVAVIADLVGHDPAARARAWVAAVRTPAARPSSGDPPRTRGRPGRSSRP
ncbi:MAG TPA: thiamine phosphate synthase [Vicinamibacterales bacterium]|nr:thiamine phosphate synthase [Vicinamibacterales bacterium]